ncbi:hypothetical protein MG293_015901 [Ovis ammon polii]|uniref:Uncharacterized protein n=1 Tax=Ovis ammon polii TaxID=230172 RepID=A0AAD4TXB4_OVIAM|nr:hypothetical protein MG293_015901 [Ovis ammon polii]
MSQTLLPFLRRACRSDGFLGARADEQQPPYRQSGGSCRAIEAGTRASVAFTCGSESACEYRGHAAVGGLAVRKGDPVTNGSGMSAPGKPKLQDLPDRKPVGFATTENSCVVSPKEEAFSLRPRGSRGEFPRGRSEARRPQDTVYLPSFDWPARRVNVNSLYSMQGAMRLKSVVEEGKGTNEFARYDDEGKEKKRSESTKLAFPTAPNTPPRDSKMLEVSPEVFSEILAPSSPSKKLISESSDSLAKNAEPLMFQKIVGGSSQERQQRDLENGPEWNKAASGMAEKELPAADSGMGQEHTYLTICEDARELTSSPHQVSERLSSKRRLKIRPSEI